MKWKGDHDPDQSGFDLERAAAGRDGPVAGIGLAPRRRAFRRRGRRSVLSVVLPSLLLSLLLSPCRRGAGGATDVYRAGWRASCAVAVSLLLVLLRRIQDLLPVRQGMHRRLAARDAAASARRLSQP